MVIKRAYKYRIYPNQTQQETLNRLFGLNRFVYNYYLRQRIDYYDQTGKSLSYYQNAMDLVKLKKHPEYVWLKEAPSQTLQQTLTDLDKAYSNFFHKRAQFPRFKRKQDKQSMRYPQHFKVEGNKVYLPKVGWLKIVLHRPVEGKMKNLTVSRTKSGQYFISIQVEQDIEEPPYQGEIIGLDLGLAHFAVTSKGQQFDNPRYLRKSERRINRWQRRLSRKQKGSHGWQKAKLKVARMHEKVSNQRQDFLHKLTRKLVEENQYIAIEDLHVKGMVKNHRLAKSISDAGWGETVRQLIYKGQWYGCRVDKIDRFFPSSKRHFKCGYLNQDLKLSERVWFCPECQEWVERDENAAQNILIFSTVGTTGINADGEAASPASSGQPL
jgi:putative transposase